MASFTCSEPRRNLVSIMEGETAFTVTPLPAYSADRDLTSPSRACLAQV